MQVSGFQQPSDQKSSWQSLDYSTRLVAHGEHWFAAYGIPDPSPRVAANYYINDPVLGLLMINPSHSKV